MKTKSERQSEAQNKTQSVEPGAAPKRRLPRWKIVALVLAGVLVLLGVGLKITSRAQAARRTAAGSAAANPGRASEGGASEGPVSKGPGGSQSFLPAGREAARLPGEEPPPATTSTPGVADRASPFFLYGGFSFFAGFAIGLAVRAIFKTVLFGAGIILLGVFALSYFGVIGPIDWASIQDWFGTQLAEADRRTAGFRDHILVSLPSAGLGAAGLVTGFKKS